MKIRLVGDELFHADKRTGRHDEANNRFSQFFGKRLKRSFVHQSSYMITVHTHLHVLETSAEPHTNSRSNTW